MNIVIPYSKFESTNIFFTSFLEKRPTQYPTQYPTIVEDTSENEKWHNAYKNTTGNYTKIIYSTKYFTMNGIYLTFPIVPSIIHKNYLTLSDLPDGFLHTMKAIESVCLSYYADYFSISKKPIYHLFQQLMSRNIKYYRVNNGSQLYLKISGIWDTEIEYGITYKIIMA
jgi:hypothetical protein